MAERIAIIGAGGGIGSAIARRAAARGARLLLIGRDAARLSALLASLPGAEVAIADATDAAALRAVLRPPLTGLAVAVGSILLKPLARLSEAEVMECFRVNALSALLAAQAAAPALAEAAAAGGTPGSILFFSSVAARTGFPQHAAIAAAKAAVEGLTLALAAELAPAVRVNCIAPSLTRTRMAEPLTRHPQLAEAIAKLHPIPRLGEAEDVAALADLLLSPAAGWITGQIIAVDGGRGSLRSRGG
ncbi:MAG: SDR family NAD(P)-dependent oxidoreductase [Rhodovarius sp.]|nr:SDR family oxidoreductase [Rhodovarius sp.]MDW8314862.1 SDR family NAD(P)-dependent oxidoreductase [Rhodovarius sp.]